MAISAPGRGLAGHAKCPIENAPANPRGLRAALEDIAVELFEKPWDRRANMRTHLEQRLRHVFHTRNVGDRQSLEQISIVNLAFVDVREREKRERHATGAHVKAFEGSLDIGGEVSVRE